MSINTFRHLSSPSVPSGEGGATAEGGAMVQKGWTAKIGQEPLNVALIFSVWPSCTGTFHKLIYYTFVFVTLGCPLSVVYSLQHAWTLFFSSWPLLDHPVLLSANQVDLVWFLWNFWAQSLILFLEEKLQNAQSTCNKHKINIIQRLIIKPLSHHIVLTIHRSLLELLQSPSKLSFQGAGVENLWMAMCQLDFGHNSNPYPLCFTPGRRLLIMAAPITWQPKQQDCND